MTPTALVAMLAALAGGYLWNAFVLAGLLLILGQTDRVGQRGLLVCALWSTVAGAGADIAHAYVLDQLAATMDFFLVDDPLRAVAVTLAVPAAVILVANLALGLAGIGLSLPRALALAVGMAALTSPWPVLGALDVGREIASRQMMTGLYLILLLLAALPWVVYVAGAWAENHGLSRQPARGMAAMGVLALVALLGVQNYQPVAQAQMATLPGRLAFTARGRVYVLDGPGGQKSALASDPGELLAWSPDGARILVQRQDGQMGPRLYLLTVRDGSFTKLADGSALANAWSPDGRALLYVVAKPLPQENQVWRVQVGEGLNHEPVQIAEGSSPTWSADGRRIALSARRAGRAQVWVLNPDGSDPIQLTTDGGENPAWSPDGEHIAYTFNSRVYVMEADGSGKRQLTTGEELFDQSPVLAWSPDGKRLAYAHFQPLQGPRPTVIYVASLETNTKVRLSGDYQPPLGWSPDGAWLAMERRGEIWGLDVTANQERRLSPGGSFAWGGTGPAVPIRPSPSYPPTPTPTPLPPAVVESPDAMVVNPKNTTTVYAGTPQGLVKRTLSGGWVASGVGMVYPLRVRAIALDPGNPSVVYAGTDGERSQQGGTLYKSLDGGGRWTASRLRDVDVYALVVDPLDANTLYAGTGKGVYKSTDAGASWQTASTGLKTSAVQTLLIDPTPPAAGGARRSLTLYAGTRQGDIYKSVDGAATWTVQEADDAPVTALALSPLRPSVVFAASGEGLYRTTDGGARWQLLAGGIWKYKLDGVVIDPKNPLIVYAVGPGGVFKSTD
ncbi:MAG: DPP IV N-terminal domain-containing protein, partial [Chloroflexota bacterium]|nr:DPP IV N-terminal domain-containing protein [Chloroflexota bacterium]